MESIISLFVVILQNSAYISCLSWLSWYRERQRGIDSFQLVVAYTIGILFLHFMVDYYDVNSVIAITISAITAYAIDCLWPSGKKEVFNSSHSLIQLLIISLISLVIFDLITSHTPITLPLYYYSFLRNISIIIFLGVWMFIYLWKNTKHGRLINLGIDNRWAAEYWCRPLSIAPAMLILINIIAWFPILIIPLTSTGILSSTILKNVAIAILIARVTSARGPLILLAMGVTLSLLRAVAGYLFLNSIGPLLVEIMVFIVLLIWLRYRNSRTVWKTDNDR